MRDDINYDDFVSSYDLPGQWHRVKTSNLPYLTLSDVKSIYFILNNHSSKGLTKFVKTAKEIATELHHKRFGRVYQFRNENALFELLKQRFSKELEKKGIDSWGRLMQYISWKKKPGKKMNIFPPGFDFIFISLLQIIFGLRLAFLRQIHLAYRHHLACHRLGFHHWNYLY